MASDKDAERLKEVQKKSHKGIWRKSWTYFHGRIHGRQG